MSKWTNLFGGIGPDPEASSHKHAAGGPASQQMRGKKMSPAQQKRLSALKRVADIRNNQMTSVGMKTTYYDSSGTRHEIVTQSDGTVTSHSTY